MIMAFVAAIACNNKNTISGDQHLTIIVPENTETYIEKFSDPKAALLKLPLEDSIKFIKKKVTYPSDSSILRSAALLSAQEVCKKDLKITYWSLNEKHLDLMFNVHQNGDYQSAYTIEPVVKKSLLNFNEVSEVNFGLPAELDLSELMEQKQ